jgi:hypothetical protein
MTKPADLTSVASGIAALSICESLLLAMGDLKIMGEKDAVGVITDAAAAHRGAAGSTAHEPALHLEVVAILERILASGNSIRRP